MKKTAVLLVVLQLLCACQGGQGSSPLSAGPDAGDIDPSAAASIAADLAQEVQPFIPPGSAIALDATKGDLLSRALGDSLAKAGFRVGPDGGSAEAPMRLQVWSTGIGETVLVRLTTPSHHLSKAYRKAGANGRATAGMAAPGVAAKAAPDVASDVASGAASPAGPLLVEAIGPGARS